MHSRIPRVLFTMLVLAGCTPVETTPDAGEGPDASVVPEDDAGPSPATSALTVAFDGNGNGAVSSDPAGIDCRDDCYADFDDGESITLSAVPEAGSLFLGWAGGGCAGTDDCTVVLDGDLDVTAVFTIEQNTLAVALQGTAAGSVTSSPAGIDCGGDCAEAYNVGTTVTLTATPGAGARFVGWTSSVCSGAGPCLATINEPTMVIATFAPEQHVLSVSKSGTGAGTISSAPGGIVCGGDCSEPYDHGTTITLSASPAAGSVFTGWSGACGGTGACTIAVNAATSVGASFAATATWDPSWSAPGIDYTNGNLSISGTYNGYKNARTTIGKSSGKYYWEITATAGDGVTNAGGLGILEAAMPAGSYYIGYEASGLSFGYGSCCYNYWLSWAGVTLPSGGAPPSAAVIAGRVYMFALDMDTGRFWAGHDGVWYSGGNPATGAAPAAIGITGTVYPGVTLYPNSINAFTANFGASGFTYGVPSGFTPGIY